ncbi:thioredoxin [Microdochium bolleyi]|uniref:Thioredoxin n=1 Tax=Microdochium bolleyi TaxID=196109 RepID=A0A136J7E8_9PEZI|nr:thioredoxin [Microdochium bolleyi]
MDVHLLVYDLSGGMARQMSMGFLGFQLDAIYHTSIELDGKEFVYDGGINVIKPGTSHLGRPLQRLHLGHTDLPMDVISEYLDSLREIFTPQAYDLFRHNCNNFSNDFSTFLVGKGIPEHITNMPQAVLDSPFGQMLQPQLTQMVEARKAQQGGLLGIQNNGGPSRAAQSAQPVMNGTTNYTSGARVRVVSNMLGLNNALHAASKSSAVVFFTSATCPPCKAMYPLYDELAAEWGGKVSLIKADVSIAMDVGQAYSIRGTPTFVTFLHGKEQERWSGADASRLRSTISLLAHMAHPRHPHESLNLPSFSSGSVKPQLYTKVPPLSKLLGKLGPAAEDAAVQGVKHFIEARSADGPADATLPDMPAFSRTMQSAASGSVARDLLFTVVDLFRCALIDPRFSGYFAEEVEHKTVLAILDAVNDASVECPYALRLVTLQMACNLFSSSLYTAQVIQHAKLRAGLTQLVSTSFLDDGHNNVRVAASSLLFNIAVAANQHARQAQAGETAAGGLPEDDQVELAASVLEAIGQEEESREALHGMLLALGYLVYCMPLEGELVDLLRAMDAQGTVVAKRKAFPDEKLVQEVGGELLGKGLARK